MRSSNINEDQFELKNDDVFVDISAVNIPYAENGDILITSANGSPRLVGKHTIIKNIKPNSTVHGGFMLIGKTSNYEFVNASMSSQWYKNFLNVYVSGGNGAIGNLSKSDMDNIDIKVPKNDEQFKIGFLFEKINDLITLHQREFSVSKKLILIQIMTSSLNPHLYFLILGLYEGKPSVLLSWLNAQVSLQH